MKEGKTQARTIILTTPTRHENKEFFRLEIISKNLNTKWVTHPLLQGDFLGGAEWKLKRS
jgi:hypothetical protein